MHPQDVTAPARLIPAYLARGPGSQGTRGPWGPKGLRAFGPRDPSPGRPKGPREGGPFGRPDRGGGGARPNRTAIFCVQSRHCTIESWPLTSPSAALPRPQAGAGGTPDRDGPPAGRAAVPRGAEAVGLGAPGR